MRAFKTYKCLRPACWLVYEVDKGEEQICPRCNAKMAKRIKNRKPKPRDHWKSKQNKAFKQVDQAEDKAKEMDKSVKGFADQAYRDIYKDLKKNFKDIKKEI